MMLVNLTKQVKLKGNNMTKKDLRQKFSRLNYLQTLNSTPVRQQQISQIVTTLQKHLGRDFASVCYKLRKEVSHTNRNG